MKGSVQIFGLLLIALFAVSGCKDQTMSPLTDSQPGLAAAGEHEVILKTRDGDGPLIIRRVVPVYWDGVSKLKSGVVYKFRSEQEKLDAYATVPCLLDLYLKLKEIRAASTSGKVKGNSEAALAATGTAYADVHKSTQRNVLKVNGSTSNSSFTPNDVMHHFIDWDWASVHYYWIDGQPHYTDIEDERSCPIYTYCEAIVQLNCCDILASDFAEDDCN